MIGRLDCFFSCPLCFFPHSRLSSYLHLFLYLISFLLFPCESVWENTRAWVLNFLWPYWMVLNFFAKRHDRNGRSVACQKLTIIIIIINNYYLLLNIYVWWKQIYLVKLLQLGRFVHAILLSIFTHLLVFFICLFVLFHSFCSHSRVLWTTLVHEFNICCCHCEWNLLSSFCDNVKNSRSWVLLN